MEKGFKIVLLGAPGAGKGTQAVKMAEALDIPQISTGDIFREQTKRDTYLGKQIKKRIDAGELVPDDIVLQIVGERLKREDCNNGFILDGFPRTKIQAERFALVCDVDCAIYLDIPLKNLTARLTGRRTCRSCGAIHHISMLKDDKICPVCNGELFVREDDNSETVKKRFEIYQTETKPVIDYYASKGKLININGAQTAQSVFCDVVKELEKL